MEFDCVITQNDLLVIMLFTFFHLCSECKAMPLEKMEKWAIDDDDGDEDDDECHIYRTVLCGWARTKQEHLRN